VPIMVMTVLVSEYIVKNKANYTTKQMRELIHYPTNRWHPSSATVDLDICFSVPRT
jgi:hypothetical protein